MYKFPVSGGVGMENMPIGVTADQFAGRYGSLGHLSELQVVEATPAGRVGEAGHDNCVLGHLKTLSKNLGLFFYLDLLSHFQKNNGGLFLSWWYGSVSNRPLGTLICY